MSFFGSLMETFNGGKQRQTIEAGDARARADAQAGTTAAVAANNKASSYFDPYAQQGGRANALWGDALGVNGAGARTAATANFAATNPYTQTGDDYAMGGVMRQLSSRGQSGGNALLAAQRVGSERWDQRYNQWMGQLQGAGQQGFQAAGAQAGLQGQNANYLYGNGQTMAGLSQQTAGAIANTQNAGIQNALGFGGMLVNGFSPTKDGSTAFGNMGRSVNRLFG